MANRFTTLAMTLAADRGSPAGTSVSARIRVRIQPRLVSKGSTR
jgi:hypothetical protein